MNARVLLVRIFFIVALLAAIAACGQENYVPVEVLPAYNHSQDAEVVEVVEVLEQQDEFRFGVLPSLHVSLPAADLHRHEWRDGYVSLTGAGEHSFDPVDARIRGRGNSTWRYMGEKRPLRFRFSTPQPMFGTEYAARDWTLIANAMDFSLMRNASAYFLGSLLSGFDFTPGHWFVHLYMDGEYRGVYMLSDQVQVLDGRVNLTAHDDPTLSEYFLEWCRHPKSDEDVYFRVGFYGVPFEMTYPDPASPAHVYFANDFMNQVDDAFRSLNFHALENLIDLHSFVDFYLVNEFFKNSDSGFSSLFFQIRQSPQGPRLFAGPLWDFDQSSGGSFAHGWFTDYRPERLWAAITNHWFLSLVRMPQTREMIADRWREIREDEIPALLSFVENFTAFYRPCLERNFERWPDKLGNYLWRTPPSVSAIATHEGQVEYLLNWFRRRVIWMDGFLLV